MTSAFIGVTVLVTLYSLWVRRDTWWTRWEIGVTVGLTLEAVALVLVSPWAAETCGPLLHHATGIWNLQQLAGHICFVAAVAANIYHVLLRVSSFDQIAVWFRRRVVRPVQLIVVAMVALFIVAGTDYHPHGFSTGNSVAWHAYWAVWCGALIYLATVATRLLLVVRFDPRARETVELYSASTAFGVAGLLAQLSTTWIHADLSTLVWLCFCVSIAIFAIGSARSWQAKAAWFIPGPSTVAESNPPQAP